MKKMRKKIFISLTLLTVFAPFSLTNSIEKNLEISLKEKRVEDLDFSGLSLIFYLEITNSSSKPFYISSYDYRLVVNEEEYLSLQRAFEKNIEVDAQQTTLISLPLRITYDHLFKVIKGIKEEDKAICYLTGGLTFLIGRKKEERLPFVFSGEFPVLKKPAIEFLDLEIKDLTIGGADLMFKVKFKNRNSFELLVERLRYSLSLGDKPVGKGQVWDDKNIQKKGEKVFLLPLLINFFEVGKEVYEILHQSNIICHLSGMAEVSTVWGMIKIPFEKRGKIHITKSSSI